ncbi:MAG TPA: PadR family transcriptional regulator [Thermodesulfobacteriota bacterium]|nr:PadR family transcriptional regulator [Thermodesulfobacteriota bacterium]
MSLPYALLGLINYQPTTGYELKATFNKSVHFFWNATLPQIYRTLNQMEKKGWLTLTLEHQNGKPSRKVYHITKSGRKEFKRWLAEPPEMPELRNAMLIKIFFGSQMKLSQFAAHLRAWREYHANLLQRYEKEVPSVIKRYAHATGAFKDALYWTLTLNYGRKVDRTVLEWCDEALKQTEDQGTKESSRKKPASPLHTLRKTLIRRD